MAKTIFVVDDEIDLVKILEYSLRKDGFDVHSFLTGQASLDQLSRDPLPDLVLLDLMLPDISGTEICRQIRTIPRTRHLPVIMLTAKGEEIDRVVGLELGADDYVVKPFNVRELLLRMRAVLRRVQRESVDELPLVFDDLRIDQPGHRVWVSGNEVILTPMEFKLLTTLLVRSGRVQTRDKLLSDVWNSNADINARTVDTHVKRLRQKLGLVGGYIETIRGVGYRFRNRPDEGAM
jgi:two-component system phosphate regulon response regulator PhoB